MGFGKFRLRTLEQKTMKIIITIEIVLNKHIQRKYILLLWNLWDLTLSICCIAANTWDNKYSQKWRRRYLLFIRLVQVLVTIHKTCTSFNSSLQRRPQSTSPYTNIQARRSIWKLDCIYLCMCYTMCWSKYRANWSSF